MVWSQQFKKLCGALWEGDAIILESEFFNT